MVASSVFVNNKVQILPNPYALTIKPRLQYSSFLADSILQKLYREQNQIQESNRALYREVTSWRDNAQIKRQVEHEVTVTMSVEVVKLIRQKLASVSQMSNLAQTVSPLISVIRIVNSNLYLRMPHVSQDLIELSGLLGSIVMDSGSLIEAKFDFKQTNLESKQILAEVNLIVESKIRTSYPNLNL